MAHRSSSLWSSPVFCITAASLSGLACTGLSLAVFSAFVFLLMDTVMFMDFFSAAPLSTGAFTGAFIAGRHHRRHGLPGGILCGAVMYAVLSLSGIALTGGIPEIKKLLLLALFGAAGGVTGVNSRRPSYLTDQ